MTSIFRQSKHGKTARFPIIQQSPTWYESAQINQLVTHYFTIRFRSGLTSDYEIVHKEKVYTVKRFRDLNEAGKYMLLECEELADASIPMRGSNGDSLFTR